MYIHRLHPLALTLKPSPLTLMLSLVTFLRTLKARLKLWNFSSRGQKVTSIGTRPLGGRRADVGVTSRTARLRGSSFTFQGSEPENTFQNISFRIGLSHQHAGLRAGFSVRLNRALVSTANLESSLCIKSPSTWFVYPTRVSCNGNGYNFRFVN